MYCSHSATQAGELLAGTAAESTRHWILLEFGHPWAKKPIMSDALEGRARDTIAGWLESVPGSRFQLVRTPRTKREQAMSLFLGCSDPSEPWLVRFELERYEDVSRYDLSEIVADRGHPTAAVVTEPMYLVCTHGKRDRCCAKWGNELYSALAPLAPNNVWQTSHLGGHRFAPTLLTLPFGICYGRVEVSELKSLVSAESAQQFFSLDKVRGRTCFSAAEQAAEVFLRQKTGDIGYGGLHLESSWEVDADHFGVCFRRPDGEHIVEVCRKLTGHERISSCAEPDDVTQAGNWEVVA